MALVSGAGYATYTIVAKRLLRNGHEPLAEVTTLVLAEPLTATALGVLVLDEHLGLSGAGGAALILGGLAVLALRRPARLLPAVEPTR